MKVLDHLPLYRQEAIFERAGYLIARSTLARWVGECGAQLQPLGNALADELRRHAVVRVDETPVLVPRIAVLLAQCFWQVADSNIDHAFHDPDNGTVISPGIHP